MEAQVVFDATIPINDSIFKNRLLDVVITSKNNSAFSISFSIIDRKCDTIFKLPYYNLSLKEGFNNFSFDGKTSGSRFYNKNVKAFYARFGHFPLGEYKFIILTSGSDKKKNLKTYLVESSFQLPLNHVNQKVKDNHSSNRVFKWKLDIPDSLKKRVSYHLHIATISNPKQIHTPLIYLKDYQWVPGIESDSLSEKQLPKALKKNKAYTYYIEAYFNDFPIGRSKKTYFFNFSKTRNNILSKVFSKQAKYASMIANLKGEEKVKTPAIPDYKKLWPLKYFKLDSIKKIRVYGFTKIESHTSNIASQFSNIPTSYTTWQFNPTVQVYTLPITGHLFMTTENNTNNQLNSFNITLDMDKFKKNELARLKANNPDITNPKKYEESLKNSETGIRNQISGLKKDLDNQKGALDSMDKIKSLNSNLDQINVGNTSKYKSVFSNQIKSEEDSLTKTEKHRDSLFHKKNDSLDKNIIGSQKIAKQKYDSAINSGSKAEAQYVQNYKILKNKVDSTEKEINSLEKKLNAVEKQLGDYGSQAKNIQNEDPKTLLLQNTNQLGAGKFLNKVLPYIDDFRIGRFYPSFSDLSLRGIAVNGLSGTFSNQKLYLNILGGTSSSSTSLNINANPTDNIYAIKTGFGSNNGNHVFVSFINFSPRSGSSLNYTNQIFGADIRITFLKNFNINGEISRSFIQSTTSTPELASSNSNLSSGASNIFAVNDGNSAFALKGNYLNSASQTKLSLLSRYIPFDFHSKGNPFLLTDVMEHEFHFEQGFFKRNITFSAFYKLRNDNVSQLKSTSDHYTSYSATLDLHFKHLPTLRITVNPYYQITVPKIDSVQNNSKSMIINASSNYNKRIGSLNMSTSINYSRITFQNDQYSNRIDRLICSEQFQFKSSLNISASFTSIQSSMPGASFIGFSPMIGFTFFKKWQNTGGIDYNISSINTSRISFTYSTTLKISNNLSMQAKAGRNILYNIEQFGPNNQYFASLALLVNW